MAIIIVRTNYVVCFIPRSLKRTVKQNLKELLHLIHSNIQKDKWIKNVYYKFNFAYVLAKTLAMKSNHVRSIWFRYWYTIELTGSCKDLDLLKPWLL